MEIFRTDAGVNAGVDQQFRADVTGNDQRRCEGDAGFAGQWLNDYGEQQQSGEKQYGMLGSGRHVLFLQAVPGFLPAG
jgi:hypothetical protein